MSTQISVSQILEDLKNGLTRTSSSKQYNPEKGCIADKYNLTPTEVSVLFKHPKLKGRKTKQPKTLSFVLVDDTEETVESSVETTENMEGEMDSHSY